MESFLHSFKIGDCVVVKDIERTRHRNCGYRELIGKVGTITDIDKELIVDELVRVDFGSFGIEWMFHWRLGKAFDPKKWDFEI